MEMYTSTIHLEREMEINNCYSVKLWTYLVSLNNTYNTVITLVIVISTWHKKYGGIALLLCLSNNERKCLLLCLAKWGLEKLPIILQKRYTANVKKHYNC